MRSISTMIALACIIILAATTNTQAQDKPVRASQWSIGPKAGLNLSHFWGDGFNKDAAHPRLAGQFGAFVTWSNDGWFAISGELLYSAKGARYRYENPFGDDAVSVTRADYLEIPIMFRGFILTEGRVRPHLSVGPSVGFLVLARSKGLKPINTDAISFHDDARKVDIGLNFGGGVNIEVGRNIWINPELRYNLGLISLGEDSDTRNGALTVGVGVGFPIGGNGQ